MRLCVWTLKWPPRADTHCNVHHQTGRYISQCLSWDVPKPNQAKPKSSLIIHSHPLMSIASSSSSSDLLFFLSFLSLIYNNKNNNKGLNMGLLLSRNLAFKFFYPFLFSKKVQSDLLFPKQLENVISLVSPRTGRHLQRYDKGCRQVVGCVFSFPLVWISLLLGYLKVWIFNVWNWRLWTSFEIFKVFSQLGV